MNINRHSVVHSVQSPISSAVQRPLQNHTAAVAKVALSSSNLSGESRENVATYVGLQQQQALLKTAQKVFTEDESASDDLFTGEIAANAAKQQTKQALAFAAIEKVNDHLEQRPRIQISA